MTKNHDAITLDDRVLAALTAVNPPLEHLMADRLALRREIRAAASELADVRTEIATLRHVCDVKIPHGIALAKFVAILAASLGVLTLAMAFFTHHFEFTTTTPLVLSLLLPAWLVDSAETRFGRWHLHFGQSPTFAVPGQGAIALQAGPKT